MRTLLNRTVFNEIGGPALTPTKGGRDSQPIWPPDISKPDLRIVGPEQRDIVLGDSIRVAYELASGPRPLSVTWWVRVNGIERTASGTDFDHTWTDLPVGVHPFGLRWPGGQTSKPRTITVRAKAQPPKPPVPEPSMLPDYPEWIDQLWPRFQREYRAARGHDPSTPEIVMWAYRIYIERWPLEAISADIAGRKPDEFAHATTPAGMPDYPTWQDVERPQLEQAARQTFHGKVPLSTMAGASWVRLRDRRTLADTLRWVRGEAVVEEPIGGPTPDPQQDPGPSGPWSHGRISTRGRDFIDGSGQKFLIRGASLLTALHDGTDYRPLLAYYASKGINVVRVFGGALEWRGTRAEVARSRARQFTQDARALGVGVIFACITDSGWDRYNLDEHIDFYARLAEEFDNVVALEIANEYYHATQRDEVHDVNRLKQLAKRVPGHIIVALSAAHDDESLDTAGGEYVPIHLDRGRDMWNEVRRVREAEAVEGATGKPAIIGESTKIAGIDQEGKFENSPNWWLTFGVLCRGFEIDWDIHSEFGLQGRMPDGPEQACFEAALQGYLSIIPIDRDVIYKNSNVNGGWGDSPVQSHNVDGVTRVYSFVEAGGDRGHSIAEGITGDPGVRFGAGWTPTGGPIVDDPEVKVWDIRKAA